MSSDDDSSSLSEDAIFSCLELDGVDRDALIEEVSADEPNVEVIDHDAEDGITLEVQQLNIHKSETLPDGTVEFIISTLKYFPLHIRVVGDADGEEVCAGLFYENGGGEVNELSQSLEPPLLGGRANIEGGVAKFKLRITVLSSILKNQKFVLRFWLASRPHVCGETAGVRTITKLCRPCRQNKAAAAAAAKDEAEGDDEASQEDDAPAAPRGAKRRASDSAATGSKRGKSEPAAYSAKDVFDFQEKLLALKKQHDAISAEMRAVQSGHVAVRLTRCSVSKANQVDILGSSAVQHLLYHTVV